MSVDEMREFGLWYVGIVTVTSLTIMFAYDYIRSKQEIRRVRSQREKDAMAFARRRRKG